jgi:hypothetical protein
MSLTPFDKQRMNESVTEISQLILSHVKIVQKFILPVAEEAIDNAECTIAGIEGMHNHPRTIIHAQSSTHNHPRVSAIQGAEERLARSVAGKAIIKHAEEQMKELEELRICIQETATHELLSEPEAIDYVGDKEKGVVKKCHDYGRDLLDDLYDANKSKTRDYEENEVILESYLGNDEDRVFMRKVIAWAEANP